MSEAATLSQRLAEATGASRELDALIVEALNLAPDGSFRMHGLPDLAMWGTGPYTSWTAPAYTASLDAALSLVERALPEWFAIYLSAEYSGGADRRWSSVTGKFSCTLARDKHSYVDVTGTGATLPLAVLSALLTALRPKGTSHDQSSG